jgi:hypothetical protein
MTMFRKFAAASVLAAGLATALVGVTPAEAKDGRNGAFAAGAAAGLVGGALVGSAVRPRYEPAPVYVEPECRIRRERFYDERRDRYVTRRVEVCD